jgi:hypothetical protein
MKKHLSETRLTYWQHARRSLGFAGIMMVASLTAAIHAFFPDLFVDSTSRAIDRLVDKRDADPNE